MSIITKGMKSNKLITQGYFGRTAAKAVGLLKCTFSAFVPKKTITGHVPTFTIEGEIE